jgi:RHS repeat-associated protein
MTQKATKRFTIRPRIEVLEDRLLLNHGLADQLLPRLLSAEHRAERRSSPTNGPQAAQVKALYRTLIHQPATAAQLQKALHFLQGGGTLEQFEAQLLGSSLYFSKRAHRKNPRFLAALARDVLGHPFDASDQQHFSALLAAGTSRTTVASLVLAERDALNMPGIQTPPMQMQPPNNQGPGPGPGPGPTTVTLTEASSLLTQATVPVDLGPAAGTRTLSFHVDAHFDPAATGAALGDQFLAYLVDPSNPSQTLLDHGQPGTALFSLTGTSADYVPGLVTYNGSTVTVDVSRLTTPKKGLLVFQLLNADRTDGAMVTVGPVTDTVNPVFTNPTAFPTSIQAVAAGPALNLANLSPSTDLRLQVGNIRYDATTNLYTADMEVQDTGAATGRQVAVVFTGLPGGVQLQNPSGTDASGQPYVSFTSAIPAGGLGTGSLSDPIEVVFSDPSQLRFALTPQILSGGPDHAPVFTAVGPLSVMPGGHLAVTLQATDPDGDPVHFSLRSTGPLPTGNLQSDGTLVLTPAPSEVGTYHLTLVASDGALETTQDVTLTVAADTVTTTRLSGVVQDSTGHPLAGVPVDVQGTSATAMTGSDGSFLLDLGSGPLPAAVILEVHGEQLSGPTAYPFIAADQSVLLGHAAFSGVNNVISRPILLTPEDTAHAVTISPAADATVTTPALPGASLQIPAGSLNDTSGHPYSGPLGLTEVSLDTTPLALPANVHPDLAVMIEPSGVVFLNPATLILPNRSGWATGTSLQLWSLNPFSGQFGAVGTGFVSADGSTIQASFSVTHTGIYFFVPQPQTLPSLPADPLNPVAGLPERPQFARFGSEIELYSGTVHTGHDLVSYQSLGAMRGLHLEYNSLWADPRPIVHFGFANLPVPTANDRLVAQLQFMPGRQTFVVETSSGSGTVTMGSSGAVAGSGLASGYNYWLLPTNGGPVEAALQTDLSSQPSGVYAYELSSGVMRYVPSLGRFIGGLADQSIPVVSVNAIDSPFGSGWGLAGLQQIVENADGSVLLIDGDGTTLLFQAPSTPGAPYMSPGGDFSTLVKRADGTFQRTLKDQTVYRFNAQNQLATVTDRNGNQSQYLYDANGRLMTLVDPVGLQTTFTYTGPRITGITDPANRTTQLQYDPDGNLMGVIDPDMSARHWEYDTQHHMTAEIDKLNNRDQDFYNFAGRGYHSLRADGSTVDVAPVEMQGLFPADQTTDAFSPTLPMAVPPSGAVSTMADPDGHVTTQSLDQRGQTTTSFDEIGPLQTAVRDANGMIVQSTNGLGNQTTYTYDTNGNLIATQDSYSGPFLPEVDKVFGFASFGGPALDGTAVGDLNGDGAPDLIGVTSKGDAQVFLGTKDAAGKPTGTLLIRHVFNIGSGFQQMTLADVNGDGKLDLVTVDPDNGVGISLGAGDGTFGALAFYAMGSKPSSIAVGDFNGDGRADVAATDQIDNTISVRFGDPIGSLAAATTYDVGGPQSSIAAGDINGDGVLDLVVVNQAGTSLTVLLGNKNMATGKGDGTFAGQTAIPIQSTSGTSVALGDLNGDNRVDIVVAKQLLLNNGDGTFTATANADIGTGAVLADVDGDKHLDILVPAQDHVNILPGKGDGTFFPTKAIPFNINNAGMSFTAISSILAADLNNDGFPDLIANVNSYMGLVFAGIRLNAGIPSFGSRPVGQHTYTYDPVFNQKTSETDELGRQKLYQIDPTNGNVLSSTIVVGDGTHNLVTTYTYFPNGLVQTITDPRGIITAFTYDPKGLLSTRTVAVGTPDQAVTMYEHDAAGNVSAITDADNHRNEFHDDVMNRRMLVHDALSHDTTLTYDAAGHVKTITDARGNVTTNDYDNFGRLIRTTGADPDGSGPLAAPVTTFDYDPAGNLVDTTDPLGHVTRFAYDARRRPTLVTDALSNITVYGYDLDNNRTSITDPNKNHTQLVYDGRNRLVSETDPLGQTITFQYDPVNHLVSKTDRDGRQVVLAYNEVDQPLTDTWIGANGATDNVIHYSYDPDGNPLTVSDNFSSVTDTYTNRNQIATVDNGGTPNVPHVVLTYTYDLAGNVLSLTDTVNGQADMINTYVPDALNRVSEIMQSGAGVHDKRVDLTYNEVGQPATVDRFADLAGTQAVVDSTYTYDGLNRPASVAYSHAGAPLASYQYTFDAADRLTQETNQDGTTTYTFDAIGQLMTADHQSAANPAESYTYDPNGNRLTSGLASGAYQIGPDNRLQADGTFTYTYDNEGNLIQRTDVATGAVRLFQWDERNRLTAVIDQDPTGKEVQRVLFTYDALDRRIAEEVKQGSTDVATYFVQGHGNALLDFVDDDGPSGPHPATLAMRYLAGPAVDQIFAQEDAAGHILWLLRDHLGSVRDIVDDSGAVVDHIIYDSFGNVVQESDPTVATRFLFAGRELDEGTGLYYDRARYYDPKLGRFLSEDPLRAASGTNYYRYVHDNPVNRTDPGGKQDDNPDGEPVCYPEDPVCYPDPPAGEPVSYPDPPATGPVANPDQPAPEAQPDPSQPAMAATRYPGLDEYGRPRTVPNVNGRRADVPDPEQDPNFFEEDTLVEGEATDPNIVNDLSELKEVEDPAVKGITAAEEGAGEAAAGSAGEGTAAAGEGAGVAGEGAGAAGEGAGAAGEAAGFLGTFFRYLGIAGALVQWITLANDGE